MDDSYEAIIIGAGISGICAAYRLREALPDANFTILEGSDSVSGTWSFWKYPGFRCDSYMTSYGLPFYKWPYPEGIVPGDQIASYLCDAVKDLGLSRYIKFRHFVESATWSSDENRWSLCVKTGKGAKTLNASFVLFCPGYYDYKTPFQSPIPGLNNFQGQVVHPQFWPDDLSYSGKRIILIGSGATAITLLPALAQDAGHVTMLQRSPSYVMAVPATRPYDKLFHTWLPKAAASWLCHWIHLSLEWMFVKFIVAFPNAGKSILFARMKPVLPSDLPMDPHFTPKYKLFEQRLGMCPDGDFFTALRQDNVQLVTDHIETVTATGVRTKGGKEIEADFIITATGLKLAPLGGIPVTVDGEKLNLGDRYLWHGCMIEGVPNAGAALGYFDSSWTKGVDTGAMKLASLMGKLRQTGHAKVTPTMAPGEKEKLPALTYLRTSATYVVQSGSVIPKVSDKGPWTGRRNWILDRITDWWYGYVGLKFEGRKDKEA